MISLLLTNCIFSFLIFININLNLYNKNVFYSIKFKFIELKNENRTHSPKYWTVLSGVTEYRVRAYHIESNIYFFLILASGYEEASPGIVYKDPDNSKL